MLDSRRIIQKRCKKKDAKRIDAVWVCFIRVNKIRVIGKSK